MGNGICATRVGGVGRGLWLALLSLTLGVAACGSNTPSGGDDAPGPGAPGTGAPDASPCAFKTDPGSTAKCTGCPATFNGLPCATTTHYSDNQMGACEMGQPTAFADVPPSNWWNFTSFTAAINSQNFNYGTANTTAYGDLGNCGGACNQCYRLTPTGGHVDGQGASPSNTDPMIIMVSNLCPGPANTQWCNASQPYGYCKDNPSECQQQEGYTNTYGYSAHFDLEDQEGQISSATAGLGWDNPEVTFEEVDCSGWYDQVNASAPYQMDLGDTASTSGPSWVPSANDTEPMTKCGAYASLTCEAGEEQVFVKDEFVSSSCSTNSASTGDIYLCNGTSQGALVSAALTTFDAISPLCLPTGTTQLVMYPCAENWSAWTVKVTPGGTTILSSSTGQSGTCNF